MGPATASAAVTALCGCFYLAVAVGLPGVLEARGWSWLAIHVVIFASRFLIAALLLLVVVPFALRLPSPEQSLRSYLDAIRLTRWWPLHRSLAPGLLAMALFWSLSAVLALVLGLAGPSWHMVLGHPDPVGRRLGWFIVVLALVPGVWEEVAFRGVVLRTLLTRYSQRTAVIGSATCFALFHLANLILRQPLPEVVMKGLVALPVGVALAFMTLRTESLLPAIVVHYLIDCSGPLFVAVGEGAVVRVAVFGIATVGVGAPLMIVLATRLLTRR